MTDSPVVTFDATAVRALVFDLDGTLLDTVADLAAAANAVRTDMGLEPLAQERLMSFVGRGADVLVHRALTDNPDGYAEDGLFSRARASFDVHYQRENGRSATPYPGVLEGLQQLAAAGLPMACVTNKPQMFTDPLLRMHGMADFFRVALGGDALAQRKPHPAPLLRAAEVLGHMPSACLMVGDSVNDAAAARAAGMPVVILPYGYNEGRSVHTIDSDGIVPSIAQVARILLAG